MPRSRLRFALAGPLAATALAAAGLPGTPAAAAPGPPGKGRVIKDRYIVTFDHASPGRDVDEAKRQARGGGARIHFEYEHAVRGFAATLPPKAVEALQRNPNVLAVERDTTVAADATQRPTPSWGLDRIDQGGGALDDAYTYGATGAGVTAYVIDTGVRSTHTDFGGRVQSGFTAVDDGRGSEDCNGHGTHVAATLGGRSYGVAKEARIVPVRVLDCAGGGTMSGVVAGVDWVASRTTPGAVANLSLGAAASDTLDAAVNRAIAGGTTFVVAAGNDGVEACTASPARVTAAITVGASTLLDEPAWFSNHGNCLDLYAPGEGITSALSDGDTAAGPLSGTSMAAPHVAGVVATYLQSARPGPAAVASAVLGAATRNALTGLGTGSPNLLLRTVTAAAPPPPANLGPVSTPPAAYLPPLGTRIGTSAVPVRLTWSAVDPNGDAIASYQLQQSSDGGASWSTVSLPSASATSVTVNLSTVANRLYRVRATDAKGLAGAYATGPALGLTLSQESAAAYYPSAAWSSSSVSGAYGGSVRRTAARNAVATFSFTGSQVVWLATATPSRGYAEVFLDGTSQGVYDLYATTTLTRLVAFSRSVPAGPHTLQVVALGERDAGATNSYVDVDGFAVLR
jgi:aqualysin 1